MKSLLGVLSASLLASAAWGADLKAPLLPVKAALVATCSSTGCTGFHADFSTAASGTGVNILDLGAASSMGTYLGVGGGYQYYNGMYWLGAKVNVMYNVGQTTDPANAGFSDKLFAFEGVEVGGNLFGLLGLAPPVAPNNQVFSMLAAGIPTAEVGACQKHGVSGMCAGATLHYFLPNTPLEIAVSYLNGQFGTSQLAPGVTMSSDNMGLVSFKYHFNAGL